MRKSFEQTLAGNYGDIAKQQLNIEGRKKVNELVTPEEEKELETALKWHLKNEAEKEFTPDKDKDALYQKQQIIFDIQKKKQELVTRLKEMRNALNNSEYRLPRAEDARTAFYQNGQILCQQDNGENIKISMGDLITDTAWGINYNLDESIPKNIRKKIVLENTRDALYDLANQQVFINEYLSEKRINKKTKNLTSTIEANADAPGMVAEKMVCNILRKISLNLPNVNFKIRRADYFEDREHKIDFIVRRKIRSRDVTTKINDSPIQNLGIQFTISKKLTTLKKKKKQLITARQDIKEENLIDDIVLVSIPLKNITSWYSVWQKRGRPSGGPDGQIDKETRKTIIRGILNKFMPQEEIDTIINQV